MSNAWPKVRLGEVMALSDTAVPSSELSEINLAGVYSFGRGLFTRGPMSPRDTSYKSYNRLVTDDFVVSQPKGWEGALARVAPEFDGWYLSPVFPTFRANRTRLEPAYLAWFCKRQSVWEELQRNSRGIGARRETVSPQTFLSLEIPLPPLAEQKRIVARIEVLAAHINEARELRRQAAEEAEALENSVAEKTFTALRASGVDAVRFEDACTRITVGHVSSMRHAYCDDGVPFLRSQNIRKNRLEKEGLCFISANFHTSNPKSALRPGDVVIVRTGFVGVACVVPDWLTESNCADLVIVRPGNKLDPHYAARFLNCPSGRARASVASVGSAQKHYNVGAMKKTMLPLPPLPEQRRIVAELDALQAEVDALKRLQAETAAELDALLPSVLDRAFQGEL